MLPIKHLAQWWYLSCCGMHDTICAILHLFAHVYMCVGDDFQVFVVIVVLYSARHRDVLYKCYLSLIDQTLLIPSM